MHKAYRDLTARVEEGVKHNPETRRLVEAIGDIDDLDPLRIPALKAMKRDPAPALRLEFKRVGIRLGLYARNLTRKREAKALPCFAALDLPAWLFEPAVEAPADLAPELQRDIIAMLKESFALFGTRTSRHFPIKWGSELILVETPHPHLDIHSRT